MATTKVWIFAGQSNMGGYTTTATLGPSVSAGAKTAANGWTGASPVSIDTGASFATPTLANSPCLYCTSNNGLDNGVFDAWGSYAGNTPRPPAGAISDVGTFGLELPFIQTHLAAYPSTPLAIVKCSLGGTSLHADWIPASVACGTVQSVSGSTVTFTTVDSSAQSSAPYGNQNTVRMLSGAAAGQERTITAYNSTTRVATLDTAFSPAPSAGDSYGVERLQFRLLRTMITQAAGRLAAAGVDYQWAGFVWMQGESGAHNAQTAADDSQYLGNARGLFADVRSRTRADLPVIVGRIGDNWGWGNVGDATDTTNANPYLLACGYPWAAIDYSINGSDGRNAGSQSTRNGYLAGARQRRATEVTLGSDPNCTWFDNDGYPPFMLFDPAWAANWGVDMAAYVSGTIANAQLYAYHWAAPGNLAAGERAFRAWRARWGGKVKVAVNGRRFSLRNSAA